MITAHRRRSITQENVAFSDLTASTKITLHMAYSMICNNFPIPSSFLTSLNYFPTLWWHYLKIKYLYMYSLVSFKIQQICGMKMKITRWIQILAISMGPFYIWHCHLYVFRHYKWQYFEIGSSYKHKKNMHHAILRLFWWITHYRNLLIFFKCCIDIVDINLVQLFL